MRAGIVINNRLNGVLAVSRSFGDLAHKGEEQALIAVPQLHQELVVDGFEFLILACDGVFDVLTNQEAVNFVRRRFVLHQDVQLTAQELVQKALDIGSVDNCSAVVVALNQVLPSPMQAARNGDGGAQTSEPRRAAQPPLPPGQSVDGSDAKVRPVEANFSFANVIILCRFSFCLYLRFSLLLPSIFRL